MGVVLPFLDIPALVSAALSEDIGPGDITAELIPADSVARAQIITREKMIVCGQAFVEEVFHQIDPQIQISWHVQEGEEVEPNQVLVNVSGRARALLSAERTALNFLQMLSGVASTVSRYKKALSGSKTQLLDTRKTIPLFRLAEKYAVRVGGGQNHRLGLYDAFLIKENHILACGSIQKAVGLAHQIAPHKKVEVEVESFAELEEAIDAGADIVMLDNFSHQNIKTAVQLNQGRVKLEVSGNVTLETLHSLAETGVDFISVGSLTKHIHAIDLSMRFLS